MEEEAMLRWGERIEALLASVVSQQYCKPYSIYLVPDQLRKCNKEDMYTPKKVSMGPRFKGKRELLPMEEVKLRCMMTLLHRTNREPNRQLRQVLDACMRVMLEHDAAVRAAYREKIILDRFELATTMLFDGCFLLESLISLSNEWNSKLPSVAYFHQLSLLLDSDIRSDLLMVENQIPLFIVYKLFQLLFPQLEPYRISIGPYICITQHLALPLFCYSQNSRSTFTPIITAAHFLELAHSTILMENNHQIQQHFSNVNFDPMIYVDVIEQKKLNRCATRLRAAGVTFKLNRESDIIPVYGCCKFDIKFNKRDGVLEIPLLFIKHLLLTETNWRNFIAFEQDTIGSSRIRPSPFNADMFTFFALLFNELICCQSDVQLLRDMHIIGSSSSSNVSDHNVVELFRSITSGVRPGLVHRSYCDMIDELNAYWTTNLLIQFAITVWHYVCRISERLYGLPKFLRRGYNFAAVLLTLLTFIQTFYAVLSYHYPKK